MERSPANADCFNHFFVQNETSAQLLKQVGIYDKNVTVSGDTRFDRVIEIAEQFEANTVD